MGRARGVSDVPNIRATAGRDVGAMAQLMTALGYPTSETLMRARLLELARDADCQSFVAEVDGEVAGMIGMRVTRSFEYDGTMGEILALVVNEPHRRRGLGAALIEAGEQWLRDHGARLVKINSSHHRKATHQFYERLGYGATGLRFTKSIE